MEKLEYQIQRFDMSDGHVEVLFPIIGLTLRIRVPMDASGKYISGEELHDLIVRTAPLSEIERRIAISSSDVDNGEIEVAQMVGHTPRSVSVEEVRKLQEPTVTVTTTPPEPSPEKLRNVVRL